MRLPIFVLAVSAILAPAAVAQEPTLSAEDVILRLVNETSSEKRDEWYKTIEGKPVAWAAPVFSVSASFSLVIVSMRPVDRGLIACNLPKRLEAAGRKVKQGDTVLCAGRIDNYERMMGAALVNVEAEDFVVGKDNIDAWQKARTKGGK